MSGGMGSLVFSASVLGTVHGSTDFTARFWCHRDDSGRCETPLEDDALVSPEAGSLFVKTMAWSRVESPQRVNASSIRKKVVAGYQGWDGARSTWDHWSDNGQVPSPSSANEHFEMVPQLGEYPDASLHATGFKYNGNGSTIHLYENAVDGVVDLHFKWMQEYGIDGVLLQRFISECTRPGKALTQKNAVLAQADAAAAKYGRAYAMMWDMSGAESSWDVDLRKDWEAYVKNYTASEQYLKEGGRPVVSIFGIGLTSRAQATPSQSLQLIRWLQAQGLYVIGSGPYYWRVGGRDAAKGFDEVHAAFDAIMPWAVGRYNSVGDFYTKLPTMEADVKLTSGRRQGYAPVAYPGYSYRDTNKFNSIKRSAGLFFRAQIDAYLNVSGVTFYYIAMFDEVQEGTAIYKIAANEAESAAGRPFVTASMDGVKCPGDLYLTIAGKYAAAARRLCQRTEDRRW
jgi:hypothetical protein